MDTPAKLSLAALNAMDRAAFVAALGGLFEHTPAIAEQAFQRRPFPSLAALHAAFMAAVHEADPPARRALIGAHPDLAGKAAIDGALTEASAFEQQSAGLDRLTPAEYARFQALNAAYRARFGIPFIICVRDNTKQSILAAFEARLQATPAAEEATALDQIARITRLRLADLVADPEDPAELAAELAAANETEAVRRHTAKLRHDLELTDYPARPWVRERPPEDGQNVHDVVVVGAGQSGLAAAFGLLREKVGNLVVLDENPQGQEGPWITYARMVTLRTPNYLTGPDHGIPALTFRAWWEAQYGADSWESLGKIPKEAWMRYLLWYRAALGIPVRNNVRVERITPLRRGLFRLAVGGSGAPASRALLARKIVLATGIQGGGAWHVPEFIRTALPRGLYAHTSQAVDFAALAGRRIGVLGGGASAFDNAQHALAQGVAEAHVFVRRTEMPRINPIRFMENAGFLKHFADLSDAEKYRGIAFFLGHNQPPTNDTFGRAAAMPGFSFHLGEPWQHVAEENGQAIVTTPKGRYAFDFLILSTGLLTDVALRPELAALAPDIALWRDIYRPPAGEAHPLIDIHPYLGPAFELTPRDAASANRLHGIFAFNYAALASLGLSASALSGMKFSLPKLVAGITRQLFLDDKDAILADFLAYQEPEFTGDWGPRPPA
jgi:OHCU decarboxylase